MGWASTWQTRRLIHIGPIFWNDAIRLGQNWGSVVAGAESDAGNVELAPCVIVQIVASALPFFLPQGAVVFDAIMGNEVANRIGKATGIGSVAQGDRAALLLIAVQHIRTGLAFHYRRQLPAQIDGVFDRRVVTKTTRRGEPLGIPASKACKQLRLIVHDHLLALRKARGWERPAVYRWMAEALEMDRAEAHVALFDGPRCLSLIARFKRPKHYFAIAELPKSNYGKVLKTDLRDRLADKPDAS